MRNSILGRGVRVHAGALVEDCVILDNCDIGRRARIRCRTPRRSAVSAGSGGHGRRGSSGLAGSTSGAPARGCPSITTSRGQPPPALLNDMAAQDREEAIAEQPGSRHDLFEIAELPCDVAIEVGALQRAHGVAECVACRAVADLRMASGEWREVNSQ